jgi:hypothetical protein
VSFGVDRNATNFAEVKICRKFEKIRYGIKRDFRHALLGEHQGSAGERQDQNNRETFHMNLPFSQ